MDGAYALAAAAEMVRKLSWCFSVTWAVLYITAGSWAKVRYRNPKVRPEKAINKRYGPAVVSHALFSIVFANPFCIFYLVWSLGDVLDEAAPLMNLSRISTSLPATYGFLDSMVVGTFHLMVLWAYFVLFSLLTDLLLLRMSAPVRLLKWLVYKSDLIRWILVHLVTTMLLLVVVNAVCWGICWLWLQP
jgi:hypothetical protein